MRLDALARFSLGGLVLGRVMTTRIWWLTLLSQADPTAPWKLHTGQISRGRGGAGSVDELHNTAVLLFEHS